MGWWICWTYKWTVSVVRRDLVGRSHPFFFLLSVNKHPESPHLAKRVAPVFPHDDFTRFAAFEDIRFVEAKCCPWLEPDVLPEAALWKQELHECFVRFLTQPTLPIKNACVGLILLW